MGWLDSILGSGDSGSSFTDYGSLLGGGDSGGGGGGGGGWGDFFNSDTFSGSGGLNWWDSLGGGGDDSGGGGSSGGGWMSTIGSLFGGGGGSGGSGGSGMGNIFGAILGGLSKSADSKLSVAMMHDKGKEDRKTVGYEAQLVDYYKSKDNYKNYKSLDQYGQFSKLSQFAPSFQQTYNGPADPGAPPSPGG